MLSLRGSEGGYSRRTGSACLWFFKCLTADETSQREKQAALLLCFPATGYESSTNAGREERVGCFFLTYLSLSFLFFSDTKSLLLFAVKGNDYIASQRIYFCLPTNKKKHNEKEKHPNEPL